MLKTRVIPCLDVKGGPRPCLEREREQDQKGIAAPHQTIGHSQC